MRRSAFVLLSIVMVGIFASGCNLPRQDTAAIQTSAALTVQAEITASSPSATATSTTAAFPTLPPTTATLPATASPTSTCDVASFKGDVTIPDDMIVAPNEEFTKIWRLENVGTCSWTPSYAVIFFGGESMSGPATQALTGNVDPGQTVDLSVKLKAPSSTGTYTGNWKLRNASGVTFEGFYVRIKVEPEDFAVTGVSYTFSLSDYAGKDDCPMMTAHITTNAAGDVDYHWTFSDGGTASVQTIHFASAGTQDVETHWALGSVWAGDTHWLGIYIDEPNHQNFGHKSFTQACAP